MILIDDVPVGIIIEVKYAEKEDLVKESIQAIHQINQTRYTALFHQTDIHKILKYGIACNRKNCKVALEIEEN